MAGTGVLLTAVFVLAAVVGLCVLPLIARLAPALGLMDLPSKGHKTHSKPTPRTGGLGIAVALAVALLAAQAYWQPGFPVFDPALLFGVFGFLVFGFSSDLYNMRPELRFLAQVTMMLGTAVLGLKIQTLGALFGAGPVVLGTVSALLFTALTGSCLVNGFNMLDGLDGLLVAVAAPMLVALSLLAYFSADIASTLLLVASLGGLLAFACFNFRILGRQHALMFLGDAGSYAVGAIVTMSLITLSQTGELLRPIDAVWIAGLPILDTVNVVISRCARGSHFMQPGRDHIHHLLLSRGWTPQQTVLALGAASAILCLVGLAGAFAGWNEAALCWSFVALAVVYRWTSGRLAARFKTGVRMPASSLADK